ncbi:MAG TPA: hypothetical protein VN665_00020 [Candidatus Paceibacterota bacterium]|nr:hypothetical protein [Candidatus Paceibacterota bacterium]
MDPQVQASFIPKKSLDIGATPRGGHFGGLIFLISLLIFIASLVAAGAAFAYTKYLTNAIASKSKSLILAEGAYDPGSIQDLVRLDSRLTQAKVLLDKHVAVSGIFAFLSTQTLSNVSFSSFTYALNDDGSANVTMNGTADSFATVALQSDQFGGNKLLKNVIFTNITADAAGHISFGVSATVDPSVLSYAATLGSNAAVPVVPVVGTSTASTTQ